MRKVSEVWKDVVGYEGIYEVSNTGYVRSKEGKTTYTKRKVVRKWQQRELRLKVSKDNTCRVSLWKEGKERTWLVHRLVALAFIPSEEGREYINHMDGNRLNNHVDNLEWCNHTENNNHAFDTGLISTGVKVTLTCKESGKVRSFRSMSKASQFLGLNKGYVSGLLLKGVTEYKNYLISEI